MPLRVIKIVFGTYYISLLGLSLSFGCCSLPLFLSLLRVRRFGLLSAFSRTLLLRRRFCSGRSLLRRLFSRNGRGLLRRLLSCRSGGFLCRLLSGHRLTLFWSRSRLSCRLGLCLCPRFGLLLSRGLLLLLLRGWSRLLLRFRLWLLLLLGRLGLWSRLRCGRSRLRLWSCGFIISGRSLRRSVVGLLLLGRFLLRGLARRIIRSWTRRCPCRSRRSSGSSGSSATPTSASTSTCRIENIEKRESVLILH